jgi:two-component system NtrC family sensor kinase
MALIKFLLLLLSNVLIVSSASATDSLLSVSEDYLFAGEFALAIQSADSVIEFAAAENVADLYFDALNQKGFILTRMGMYDSAFRVHNAVLESSIDQNRPLLEFKTRYYIGVTTLFIDELEDAKRLFTEAVDFFFVDDRKFPGFLGRSLTNLAFISFRQNDFRKARQYLESSSHYLNTKDLEVYHASNLSLMAIIAFLEGDSPLAEKRYKESLKIYETNGRRLNLSGNYLGLAMIAQEKGEWTVAEMYLDKAEIAAKSGYMGRELVSVYEQKFIFLSEKDAYKEAVDVLLKKEYLEDSIRGSEQLLRIAKLEMTTDQELEELKVSMLQRQLIAEKQNNKLQKVWIFIVVIISLYLLGFLLVYRKLVKDKNRSQDEMIGKNIELAAKNQQLAKAQKVIIQSEKMALLGRISAGIAHELNTPVSAIKGNLELIESLQRQELQRLQELANDVTPEQIIDILSIIKESIKSANTMLDPKQTRERRSHIEKYFNDVAIENKDSVVDYFTEMGIEEDLHRYVTVYSHKRNVELLDLATSINSRVFSTYTAMTATDKAMKILSGFKTYSFKRGWKEVKPINLQKSFGLMLQLHKGDLRNITLKQAFEGDLFIEGIQDELDQVWTNLITNSVHAMEYEGSLSVEMKGLSDTVSVSIEDTGGGVVLPENQDIFEPFFTTKAEGEGSGLGLDISKQIVKNHNGSITWENTELGARFTVVLPRKLDKSIGQNV